MNDSTYIFLATPLVAGILLMGACDSCGETTSTVPDAAPPLSASPSTAPPTPSTAPSAVPTAWAVVETLGSVEGRWGVPVDSKGAWASIQKGKSPYPWRVTFAMSEEDSEYDCGAYEQLTDDWRVAYCKGGNLGDGRRALRLTLHVKPDAPEQLRIQLSSLQGSLILGRQ